MDYLKNIDKKYLIVPISMILASIYVYYNKTHIVKKLVDPGDGSPEVMEIYEESAKLNDYLLVSVGIGILTFSAVYFSSGGSLDFLSKSTGSSNNGSSGSGSGSGNGNGSNVTEPITKVSPQVKNLNTERIKIGPANF